MHSVPINKFEKLLDCGRQGNEIPRYLVEIVSEEDIQLEHGYLMEDYIMEKVLK